jgi:hypothetical protein
MRHSKYLELQQVVWRLEDGTLSYDALRADQEIGEWEGQTLTELVEALKVAIGD